MGVFFPEKASRICVSVCFQCHVSSLENHKERRRFQGPFSLRPRPGVAWFSFAFLLHLLCVRPQESNMNRPLQFPSFGHPPFGLWQILRNLNGEDRVDAKPYAMDSSVNIPSCPDVHSRSTSARPAVSKNWDPFGV